MNYNDLAKSILELVGSEKNIASLTHCVTRLCFNLKGEKKAKRGREKESWCKSYRYFIRNFYSNTPSSDSGWYVESRDLFVCGIKTCKF